MQSDCNHSLSISEKLYCAGIDFMICKYEIDNQEYQ